MNHFAPTLMIWMLAVSGCIQSAPDSGLESPSGLAPGRIEGAAPPADLHATIIPSHGSANVALEPPPTTIRLEVKYPDGSPPIWSSNIPPNSTGVFIPFLEPAQVFRLLADVSDSNTDASWSMDFETTASPHAWAKGESNIIHPGGQTQGHCTLSAIMRDETNETLYAILTAHCGSSQEEIRMSDGTLVGTIIEESLDDDHDFRLVQIVASSRHLVHPGIPHWTGPTQLVRSTIDGGDSVCWYGWGNGFGALEETRHRCGPFGAFHDRTFTFEGLAQPGDSGAPVIHHESGELVGYLTSSAGPLLIGHPLCVVLDELEERGFKLQLATAPYLEAAVDPHLSSSLSNAGLTASGRLAC